MQLLCAILSLVIPAFGADIPGASWRNVQPGVGADVAYGRLPLAFEPNHGQTDGVVRFLSRGAGYTIFLTDREAVLALERGRQDSPRARDVLRLQFVGASTADPNGLEPLPGRSNYFVGAEARNWHRAVPRYSRVSYAGIYPGIDLVYHGNQRQLEYDFVVAPGADPGRIRLRFGGTTAAKLDQRGDLVLSTPGGEIRQSRPLTYQLRDSQREWVGSRYVLHADGQFGFEVARYDATRPLVIDPTLVYSTYLGGTGDDFAQAIALDAAGNAYVAGVTASLDFPSAPLPAVPVQAANAGGSDVFISKLNAAGSALVYSTYLGGTATDSALAIAVDSAGGAYVTGYTDSTNFPVMGAVQPTNGGTFDLFLTRLSADGSALSYSTYLGGALAEVGFGVAVDGSMNAYVTGFSNSDDYPVANALQPDRIDGGDVIVSKINAAGSALTYSTYLGGSDADTGRAIAVDAAGNAYLTGFTASLDFPRRSPFQAFYQGGAYDGFATKLNAAGSALVYATYLGGLGDDFAKGIAVDAAGSAYLVGDTSSANFPVTAGVFQPAKAGGLYDAFATRLAASGSTAVFSTFLGGSFDDSGLSIAVDSAGNAHLAGDTGSGDFPYANPMPGPRRSGIDAYVAKLDPAGASLVYATPIGGTGNDTAAAVAVDAASNAYIAGYTTSDDFPERGPPQDANAGGYDAFVAKLGPLGDGGGTLPGGGASSSDDGGGGGRLDGFLFILLLLALAARRRHAA